MDVQIWNAFDRCKHFQEFSSSWGSLESVFKNGKASFAFDWGKENRDVGVENQFLYASCSRNSSATTPFKAVNTNGAVDKSRIRGVLRKDEERNVLLKRENGNELWDEARINEDEIARLRSRLEAFKLEKSESRVKFLEKGGRVLPGKKQSFQINDDQKLFEEIPVTSSMKTAPERGMSLDPAEIISSGGRGMSMWPSENRASVRLQRPKQEMIAPLQSRRKSCFFKLHEIDEEKVLGKVKAKGLSAVTKAGAKAQVSSRQAVTSIASRANLKKEHGVVNKILPMNLLQDFEKSVSPANKKRMRSGRVVASTSRYKQSASHASAIRKRSLPENVKDSRCVKKRSLSVGKTRDNAAKNRNLCTESRVKKRWEISSEIIVHGSLEDEKSPPSTAQASAIRKRYLPENEKGSRCGKKRSLSVVKNT